jgi:glycosyltransferase involved in cell wall biosynthesis
MGLENSNTASGTTGCVLAAAADPLVRYSDALPVRPGSPSGSYDGAQGSRRDAPMKIAIVNQPQDPIVAGEEQRGSVAIVNWELAKRLAERHEVTVYAPRAAGQASRERWQTIEIRRVRFVAKRFHKAMQLLAGRLSARAPYINSPLYYREYFMQVERELAASPVDILHFPQQLQFAARFKRAVPRAKIVLHMHQDELAQLDYSLLRRQLANVDSVVTVSDFVTDRARARFPQHAAAIHTIGNGVDVRRFIPDAQAGARAHRPSRLLFVGRISPDKGVHLLIEAFDRVAGERPDVELTLVGKVGMLPFDLVNLLLSDDADALDSLRPFYGQSTLAWLTKEVLGHKRSYRQQLEARLSPRSAGRVHFAGSVSLEELIRLYSQADLLVLPSIWRESYGLPVAESMASGVPVLASDCGGVPELVEPGVTGLLVPRLNVDELTNAMRDLLSDRPRLREMGRAARVRAERLLTWDRSAQRLERIYLDLVDAPDFGCHAGSATDPPQ